MGASNNLHCVCMAFNQDLAYLDLPLCGYLLSLGFAPGFPRGEQWRSDTTYATRCVLNEFLYCGDIEVGVQAFSPYFPSTASRRAAFARVCQPGPSARSRATTSASRRIVTRVLGLSLRA